ncbi:MAG: protein-glutamate O-methyltransferase CheR [Ignavibacteriales bacterium]|nr:MAG: protein-glutamate O-methyltransferase CheR [Ignavibacteriales bacterium]
MALQTNTFQSAFQPATYDTGKDLVLSAQGFSNWRKYIYDNCGIYFQDNKKYLLESRLLKRIKFLGLQTYEEYFDFIRFNTKGLSEKKYLYEAITINETFFFRNQPQLDAMVSTIIPDLIKQKANGGKTKIKIWSAASSSGEEAYSIAMVLTDLIKPKYPNVEFEIVGTDINFAVVETAKRGVYREYSIRNAPPYYLKKYFRFNNGEYEIDDNIRKMASFKILNLFDEAGMKSMINFDIIFCANVLIYFDAASKIKVVSNLYNSLNRSGYLFIGYAETLHGISNAFKIVSYPKTIGYKKE